MEGLRGFAVALVFLVHYVTLLGVLMPPAGNRPELFWLLLPVFFGLTFILSTILFAAVERPFSIEVKPTVAERFAFLRRVLTLLQPRDELTVSETFTPKPPIDKIRHLD